MTMPIWSGVLRLCLCVALVFNGAATAVASVQMAHMHGQLSPSGEPAAPATVRMASDTDEGMPCHTQQAPAKASPLADGAAGDNVPAPKAKHPAPDCCKSGACRCACLQHGTAAIPVVALTTVAIEHADSVRPMALAHPTPALPHLIRPPIG